MAPPNINLADFQLVWKDEFNSLSISGASSRGGANWYTQQMWGGGFSNALFLADPTAGQFQLASKAGESALEIRMIKRADGQLTSGLISNVFPDGTQASPHTTARGHYAEVRMWLPDPLQGIWPAFWAIETERLISAGRDHVLELDVLEHYGAAMPDRYTTVIHDWNWADTALQSHGSVYQRKVPGNNVMNTGWHT